MNKFLLASAAVLGLAGAAVAQEAPAFYGVNPYTATVDGSKSTASTSVSGQANASLPVTGGFTTNQNENYSGK